jgi:hypothetical protein
MIPDRNEHFMPEETDAYAHAHDERRVWDVLNRCGDHLASDRLWVLEMLQDRIREHMS